MAKPAAQDIPIDVEIRDPRCPPDIETVVRHKALQLEQHFRHLTRVLVVIESAPVRAAGPCKVRVELDVPQGDVVVHQSEATDIQLAVIDAMDAAGKLIAERFAEPPAHPVVGPHGTRSRTLPKGSVR